MENNEKIAIASLVSNPGWPLLLKFAAEVRDTKAKRVRDASHESVNALALEWRGFAEAVDIFELMPQKFAKEGSVRKELVYGQSI